MMLPLVSKDLYMIALFHSICCMFMLKILVFTELNFFQPTRYVCWICCVGYDKYGVRITTSHPWFASITGVRLTTWNERLEFLVCLGYRDYQCHCVLPHLILRSTSSSSQMVLQFMVNCEWRIIESRISRWTRCNIIANFQW